VCGDDTFFGDLALGFAQEGISYHSYDWALLALENLFPGLIVHSVLLGFLLFNLILFSNQDELYVQRNLTRIFPDHIGVHKSNYTCEWATCPRRGLAQTSRFALISHIRSHTGEKPFTCTLPGTTPSSFSIYQHDTENHT
jgi:hypothetical protein